MAANRFIATCGLCCGFCEGGKHDSVRIHVWDRFRAEALRNTIGDYMRFEHGGRKYSIDVVKKAYRTMFTGSGWFKFTSDNNLRNGSVVIFDMKKRPRQAYIGKFSEGIFQANPGPAVDELVPDADSSGEEAEDNELTVDYTKGVNLTGQEGDKLNATLLEVKKVFAGKPIVHRLTPTNIADGNMKLPRKVAAGLHIPKQGMLGVNLQDGNARTVVSYITSSDGRIVLSKEDWRKFVTKSSLETHKHIMFYLKNTSKPQLTRIMVVCKI